MLNFKDVAKWNYDQWYINAYKNEKQKKKNKKEKKLINVFIEDKSENWNKF